MNEITRIKREWIFMMQGIVIGVVLGLCGNLVITLFYDVYRSEPWMPLIAAYLLES